MSRVSPKIFLQSCNRHVDLLERANPLDASVDDVLHWSEKTSDLRREENSREEIIFLFAIWILTSCCGGFRRLRLSAWREVSDFKRHRNLMFIGKILLHFQKSERIHQMWR